MLTLFRYRYCTIFLHSFIVPNSGIPHVLTLSDQILWPWPKTRKTREIWPFLKFSAWVFAGLVGKWVAKIQPKNLSHRNQNPSRTERCGQDLWIRFSEVMGHWNKYWRTNKGLLFWNSRKQLVETFRRLWEIVPEKWVFVRRLFRSKFSYVYYNEFVGVDRFGQRVDWLMWLMLWVLNPSPPWLFPKKIRSLRTTKKTHEKIYQGPCLSSSKLSEGGRFWVSRLMWLSKPLGKVPRSWGIT